MNNLTIILLLLSFSAFGQVRWYSWATPAKTLSSSGTLVNDSTVNQLFAIEAKPGYKYIVQEVAISDSVVVQAESLSAQSGVIVDGGVLGGVDKTDWIKYTVDFKKPRTKLVYAYAMGDSQAGQVQFRTGSITGPVFATVELSPTGGWGNFVSKEVSISYGQPGSVDVFLTFTGSPRPTGSGGNIDWWSVR